MGADAAGTFVLSSTRGPVGTQVKVSSVTPCPPGTTTVTGSYVPSTESDAVLGYLIEFPVAQDGTWAGTFSASAGSGPGSGPAQLSFGCGTLGYAPQTFLLTPAGRGYWLVTQEPLDLGCFCPPGIPTVVAPFGDANRHWKPELPSSRPVAIAANPDTGAGYWLVGSDGAVSAYGDARSFGSPTGMALNQPIVGIAVTPTGAGYWLVAADGGIFAFGDARFLGSTGNLRLNQPIVGMAATPTGAGYWLVAADGGIFAFGDARFAGSTGARRLNQPIVGMAPAPTGTGYWLVAADGGIFTFGDARFVGSATDKRVTSVIGMATAATGDGYWVATREGAVFPFGSATDLGSCAKACMPLNPERPRAIVGIAATPATTTR
jgi:hypothetical protein